MAPNNEKSMLSNINPASAKILIKVGIVYQEGMCNFIKEENPSFVGVNVVL